MIQALDNGKTMNLAVFEMSKTSSLMKYKHKNLYKFYIQIIQFSNITGEYFRTFVINFLESLQKR